MSRASGDDPGEAGAAAELASCKAALERYRRLFDLSNLLTLVTNMAGRPVELDRRWTDLLGFDENELRASTIFELAHPDDLLMVRAQLARLGESGETRHFEARHRRRDGGHRWLSWRVRSVAAEGRIYAVATDVTARKVEQRRDAEIVRTLEMAEEMSHMGWWSMDPNSRQVVWSSELYRILGRDPLVFRPTIESALSVYHPDDRPAVKAARERAFDRGEPFRFECRVLRPNGEIRWVASYGRAEVDAHGSTTRLFGVFQDITERVQAAGALATLALVASRTSNAVIIADHQGRIEWANDGFERLSGYAVDEARGLTPRSLLLGPESSAETVDVLTQHLRRGSGWTGEVVAYHRSGRRLWVNVEVQPLLDDEGGDHADRFMAILTDITARKQAEEQSSRAREAAIEASRVKSQFLANMSHEIRTPLNGVIGSAQLLLQTSLTREQREYAEAIDGSGHVLRALIDDVLDISKIEAGRLELENAPLSLRQLVEEILQGFRPLAARKGIALRATFADDLPARHRGDAVRVRQIFTNLLGNAIKFTERGAVTLVLRRNPDTVVYFTVRDSGIGIPVDRRDVLFQPFVQADDSTTRRFGGTGLGLAITRELVHKMDGAIWFDSEVGEGTTFHVTLALAEMSNDVGNDVSASNDLGNEAPAAGPFPLPAQAPLAPTTPVRLDILLAEDNPVNAMVARRLLELDGHKVTLAVNGQLAVEAVMAHDFDLVLMDVQMPVLDGFEATRRLRQAQRPEQRRLPIVALTANAMKGDRDRCIVAGMDAYLTKPLDPSELRRTVRELGTRGEGLFNRAALLTRVGGDLALGFLIGQTFCDRSLHLLGDMTRALGAVDLPALALCAHALRGALGTVAAGRALRLAQDLEAAALSGDRARCFEQALALEEATRHLVEELKRWGQTEEPARAGSF